MATLFSKVVLSGSTSGKQILVATSATAGTLIHTAHATALDEVWMWATNSSTTAVKITVEWGESVASGNIEVTVPGESGPLLVVPGLPIKNSLVVRCFAGTINVITIGGYVNRLT